MLRGVWCQWATLFFCSLALNDIVWLRLGWERSCVDYLEVRYIKHNQTKRKLIHMVLDQIVGLLLSSLWVSRTGSASDWCALREALYKCIDTIQYNAILVTVAAKIRTRGSGGRWETDTLRAANTLWALSFSTNLWTLQTISRVTFYCAFVECCFVSGSSWSTWSRSKYQQKTMNLHQSIASISRSIFSF